MSGRKDGGPAFPKPSSFGPDGMTLRDWFAGQADISGVEFPDFDTAAKALGIDPPFDESYGECLRFSFRVQAAMRFIIADAMLAARNAEASK